MVSAYHFIALVLEPEILICHTHPHTRPQSLMASCQHLSEESNTTTRYTHIRTSAHSLRKRVTQWHRTCPPTFHVQRVGLIDLIIFSWLPWVGFSFSVSQQCKLTSGIQLWILSQVKGRAVSIKGDMWVRNRSR